MDYFAVIIKTSHVKFDSHKPTKLGAQRYIMLSHIWLSHTMNGIATKICLWMIVQDYLSLSHMVEPYL